ncbi:transcriptional regulator [Jannaschia pagri]|uniref:Transcriptional regulator n=1 Tax=Jannaschia pagri TaxID=2829797 RepID=A0ABQ4NLQ8_9RHOB|nr:MULTISPECIES: hydrogen peroxide-inducible genes activator [unclassified Jannaschia]GIT91516.1 transcriptional regulator [Jannaschia sp. AI_61]GIT95350.1 transcriptional regulator [Jannaschia sp. AI_62]
MIGLTIRQMRYFDALARHGHFGRAADASAISQPALSVQIKEMEALLGRQLVERAARQVRLTTFGEEVLLRVRDILRAVDELGDLARAAPSGLSGRLRLGVIPTVAPYLLPRLVAAVTRSYPALDLDVRETITPRLLDELAEGRLDTAIVALPVSEPTLSEVPLFDEAFVLVRPEAEAGDPMPAPDQLSRMRLLLLEEGHCFRDQALSFCTMPTARPRHGLDGSALSTLVQMVGAGLGVTLIPEMAVPVETRSAPVAVSHFPEPQPRRTVGMIWRRSTPLAAQLDGLAGVIRQAVAPGEAPCPPTPRTTGTSDEGP